MRALTQAMGKELVVYHSAYGLRPAILEFAESLRAAGHRVHTADLYDGEVFTDRMDAVRKIQDLGFDELMARAGRAVERLPNELVYIGFSNGGACAEWMTATRPGAQGAVLIHAPLWIKDLGWNTWPKNVPVQVHFAKDDPIRNQAVIDALAEKVRASGSAFEAFDYDAAGHLFFDPAFPAYNAAAATLLTERVLKFLAR